MNDLVKVPTGKAFAATGESRKESMPLIRTAFDAVNKADTDSQDVFDAIGEAISFLHLCPPSYKDEEKTPIENLKGYQRSDIFQTEHTFRLTSTEEQLSFLKYGSKKAMVRFEDYKTLLVPMIDHYGTVGGRAHYKALLNKDGTVHENASEEFKEAFIPYSNEMGFEELASVWQDWDKAATQRRSELRDRLAARTVVLENQPLVLKTSKGDLEYEGNVVMIADPVIRAFVAANEEKAKKERDKLAAQTVKSRDVTKIESQIETWKSNVDRWDGMESKAGTYSLDSIHKLFDFDKAILAAYESKATFLKSKDCKVVARKKKK